MNAGSKTRTVHQLVDDLRTSLKAQRAGIGEATGEIAGPVFTFLIGAGFSVTAGVPSTAHLVRAMEYWMKHGADFVDCFENTKDEAGSSGRVTEDYFSLMDTVLSDVVARRTFIAAAIRWARQHKVQMNRESILLSTLLLAGAKREVPLAKDSEHSSEIRRAFARCVYTTSFDELLPTTFYLGNEVADILDTQVIRRVDSLTDYPSVVYLHGRHLHYDLRNTRGEIRPADHQEPSAYALCQQFRDALEKTGLIVIGYSGADDRVTKEIIDAANSPGHLPRRLYWGIRSSPASLHHSVRSLIENSDDAFYLEPADAQETMEAICKELGIDATSAIVQWREHALKVLSTVSDWAKDPRSLLEDFIAECRREMRQHSTDRANALIRRWEHEYQQQVAVVIARAGEQDKRVAAALLHDVGRAYLTSGKYRAAAEAVERALALHRELGAAMEVATDLLVRGHIAMMAGDTANADTYYQEARLLYDELSVGELGTLVDLGKGWYQLMVGEFVDSQVSSRLALEADVVDREIAAMAYYNLCHALWLGGDASAVERYKSARGEYRPMDPEFDDFEQFIARGLVAREQVLELLDSLGYQRNPDDVRLPVDSAVD